MSRLYDALRNAQKDFMALRPPPRRGGQGRVETMRLHQAVEAELQAVQGRVVQVSGCKGGEGASRIAGDLARFAVDEMGKSVLLLDTSQRAPRAPVLLPGPTGPQSAAEPDIAPAAGLVLGALPARNAGARDLDRQRLREYWARLGERVDMIVLDAPPVLTSTSGLSLAASADAVILVLEAEATRAKVAEAARDALTGAGANLLGIVLNKRRFHIPRAIYEKL